MVDWYRVTIVMRSRYRLFNNTSQKHLSKEDTIVRKQIFSTLIMAIVVFAGTVAYAAPDLTGKSGSVSGGVHHTGETTLEIKQVTPGVADLTFLVNSGIVLNQKLEGTVFSEPDKSGKGTAYVVPGSDLFCGTLFGLTGVGPAWAGSGGGDDIRFDLNRMYSAPMSGESVTIRIELPKKSFGTVFAVVPVIIDANGRLVAWGSHPFGPTRHMLTRRDGTKDMLTILTVTKYGNIRAASPDEVKKYHELYKNYF